MDEIQRKLELFEKRLAGRWAFHRRMISSAPLLFAAMGLILGICLQRYLEINVRVWLVLLLLLVLAAVAYSAAQLKYSFRVRPAVLAYVAMLCAVCLGAVRLAGYKYIPARDIRNFVGRERVLSTIRGSIITEPYTRYKDDWAFAKFSHSDPSSSFYLRLREAEAVDGWEKVSGKIRVIVDEPILDLETGDYIEAYCWLSRFRGATNPGQFDLADYLGNRNVYVGASVKSRQGIKLFSEKKNGSWAGVKVRFRQIVSGTLLDEELIQERQKGLLEALLLGYRGNIDADTYRAFEKTGLLHFISLSGMHLGILVGMVWWLTARIGLLKPARAFVCIVVMALFVIVVPPRAPTIRAAVIFFVFCLSVFFRRYPNPLNSLSVSAIALLLVKPTNLFEPGWQLSFACVLGILSFAKGINGFLHARLLEPFAEIMSKNRPLRIFRRGLSYLLLIFAVGLSAWLGGAGILLYHFYKINPLTFIWTTIAFPFVACILGIGFLKIIISFLLPSVSVLLAVILNLLSAALIVVVEFLSRIDFSEILVGRVPVGVVLLYYGGIAVIAWAWYLRPLARRIIVVCTVLLVIGTIGFIKWQSTYPKDLQMTCLDVGHGQAIVMQSPDGTLLFDAGSQYNRNIGQRVIVPFLRCCGIDRLDAVIISHDDIDHINGVVETVKDCDVDDVYASAAFVNKNEEFGTAKYLADCLSEEGIELKQLGNTVGSSSQVQVDVLWPDAAACEDESLSDNDKSVVSLIEFAGRRILLCADIEEFARQRLLERCSGLHADIVVVPHHGSVQSGGSGFLKSLDAQYLICSCGISHFERVRKSAPNVSGTWFYTARDGAVRFRISRDGQISVRSY
jgi:competence protein ComEC